MNYELAKKLELAGYKFKTFIVDEYIGVDKEDGGWIKPTLSELIEACGKDFISLKRLREPDEDGCFWASADNDARAGETPEEAMALLWLALQERKVK